jgi:myosin heavy subunit
MGEDKVDYKQLWMATEALARTKQMRNFFQLERDKINAFWEITKKESENVKAELRNKDREIEEMHERHQVEMKVYKQKVRHLLYEHKVQIAELKTESERALKNKLEEHREKEADLKRDKRDLKKEKDSQELEHDEQIHRMRQDHDKELTLQMQRFERNIKEMQMKYEKRIKNLREEMELKRKAEIDDIERRKTEHIKELMAEHDKAFQDIREYYNDITSNNLELIKNLKEQVSNMKRNEAYNEKLMFEIAQENKRLTEPLTKALKEVNLLRHELANYEKDKQSLKNAKQRLLLLEDQFKTLSWEHEVLQQRYDKIHEERDKLYERYQSMLHELQQKAVFKNVLLSKKMEVLTGQLEKKDAQLGEVLKASNLEPGALGPVERKLEDMLNAKNSTIEEMQLALAEITQQHEAVTNTYESYLHEHGVAGLLP